jgi:hypothetical protein
MDKENSANISKKYNARFQGFAVGDCQECRLLGYYAVWLL